MNTTAVELGLGTGGWHVVHWNLAARRVARARARPHHEAALHEPAGRHRRGRGGAPGDLPSRRPRRHAGGRVRAAQPGAVRGRRAQARRGPSARVAYVMTDGAALPLALSDLVADLRDAGAGRRHRHRRPRVRRRPRGGQRALGAGRWPATCSAPTSSSWRMGPGVVGTGTRARHTALEVGAVARRRRRARRPAGRRAAGLAGRPAAPPPGREPPHAAPRSAWPPGPGPPSACPGASARRAVRADLEAAGLAERHRLLAVDDPDVPALLDAARPAGHHHGPGPERGPRLLRRRRRRRHARPPLA